MTDTELANVALGYLGVAPIVTLQQNSPAAEHLRRMWGITRDELLRRHHWNFALKAQVLTALADAPVGWAKAWQLPTDYIAAIDVNGRPGGNGRSYYEVFGNTIQCDDDAVTLRYVARIESVSLWDSSFCLAFGYRLAAAVAPALSKAVEMADAMRQQSEQIVLQAKVPDNSESRARALMPGRPRNYRGRQFGYGYSITTFPDGHSW